MTILPAKRSNGANGEENKETVQQTVWPFISFAICRFFCYRLSLILQNNTECAGRRRDDHSQIPPITDSSSTNRR